MICTSEQMEENNFEPFNTVSTYYSESRQTSVLNLLLGSVPRKFWSLKVTDKNTVLYNNRAAICTPGITSLSPKSPALHKLKIFKSFQSFKKLKATGTDG